MRIFRKLSREDEWVSLSDIMTSLMLVFLFIAVYFIVSTKDIIEFPKVFQRNEVLLHSELNKVLKNNLSKWGADLDTTGLVRFINSQFIQFDTGSSDLSPQFKSVIDEFFKNYLTVVMKPEIEKNIKEIYIEGHTSTYWSRNSSKQESYIANMNLSQARAQSTLVYLLSSSSLSVDQKKWLSQKVRAIGYSSSKPLNNTGEPLKIGESENPSKSQRVDIRVVTTTEEQIRKLANEHFKNDGSI